MPPERTGAEASEKAASKWSVTVGDCREVLATLPEASIQTCVTSPPYFGLRDYGVAGQIGLEPTPEAFVAELVAVFREVRRVLRSDGTLWLNLGDSYVAAPAGNDQPDHSGDRKLGTRGIQGGSRRAARLKRSLGSFGLAEKNLLGIPWRVAFALQADGWILRSDCIWHKPNPMPESVQDRPTKAHEYLFLFAKSARYFYDAAAIMEEATNRDPGNSPDNKHESAYHAGDERMRTRSNLSKIEAREKRNKRTVWTVPSAPFAGAHFATFPPALIEPCVLAGAPVGAEVLDPFAGAGTTGLVALRHQRGFRGIELNPTYAEMARRRILDDLPLLNRLGAA